MKIRHLLGAALLAAFSACSDGIRISGQLGREALISPDYKEVTIPVNIAPLNFSCLEGGELGLVADNGTDRIELRADGPLFRFPEKEWRKLLQASRGKELTFTLCRREADGWKAYRPFRMKVAEEPVDTYLAYRLIPPGYEQWNRMGIYQRNLETFEQTAVYENRMSGKNCVNCHSFCNRDPEKLLFHMRQTFPGTVFVDGEKMEKADSRIYGTSSSFTYPAWHPSGRYVAFSVNDTYQMFHGQDRNRVEVYDKTSDIVVYDVRTRQVVTTASLFSPSAFETFPAFSPDGKTLYFCSASARAMPADYKEVRYDLCSIAFDPDKGSFGNRVDTLYRAAAAGKSVSFPRVSPDGRYLMFTLSDYGNFSIWHQEADLWNVDLRTRRAYPLDALNSPCAESYHSWSGNSRWVVFSSRRGDGLYTRPYLAYMDADGRPSKPFLLPQEDGNVFYHELMYSYNIPEFVSGKVSLPSGGAATLPVSHTPGVSFR